MDEQAVKAQLHSFSPILKPLLPSPGYTIDYDVLATDGDQFEVTMSIENSTGDLRVHTFTDMYPEYITPYLLSFVAVLLVGRMDLKSKI